MINISEIMGNCGFSIIPAKLKSLYADSNEVYDWFSRIDFDEALNFYGLRNHKNFMALFSHFRDIIEQSIELKAVVWTLNNYLFSAEHYGWEHFLERSVSDMLPAFILLSGYEKHQINMKKHDFDSNQEEKHKKRIFECCTIGLDTYHINGVELSQLIWGSIFINAHIIELGRLQFEIKKYKYDFQNFHFRDKFCIGIHIPRGHRLEYNEVEKSLQQAQKDILNYFSELKAYPVYFLDSWLLSNDLDEFLLKGSNISLFRKRFDVLGYKTNSSISKFLFNTPSFNIQNYPENTSLRRLVKNALLSGHKFYDGIGILKSETARKL
ncbi:MAG: hypothetical protein ACLTT2_03385 [Alphaproteobacteria bacterium]